MFSDTGFKCFCEFILCNGSEPVCRAFETDSFAVSHWANLVDDDGHLEMPGMYTNTGNPVTIRFTEDEWYC